MLRCNIKNTFFTTFVLLNFATNALSLQDSTKRMPSGTFKNESLKVDSSKKIIDFPQGVSEVDRFIMKSLLEKESWKKDFGVPLFSGIIGALLSLLIYLIQHKRQRKDELEKQRRKYQICLESIKNELNFYCIKLEQVDREIENLQKEFKENTGHYVVPSYSFYPGFLEQSKIELNKFFENSEIVDAVGHCHFELCHIADRLDSVKRMFSDTSTELLKGMDLINRLYAMAKNFEGINALIKNNITDFKKTISKMEIEIRRTSGQS